ncbi:MAG: alcohol dehydrogenase catalytic domain-containing protein [Vulcanimicrobiota bacterium]
MLAVVAAGEGPSLEQVPPPEPAPGEALLEVELVGICRTDALAAYGRLPVPGAMPLGHEFSAKILKSASWPVGQRVAVNPWSWCGHCPRCSSGHPYACAGAQMLGLHRPGALAPLVAVPERALYPVELGPQRAAYVEPVAATLASAALLPAGADVLVPGQGRIAALTRRVLGALGYAPHSSGPSRYAVETDPDSLTALLEAVEPGGTVVIKSRVPRAEVPLLPIAQKQLQLKGAWCGSYEQAIELVQSLEVEDLFGPTYRLDQAPALLALDRSEALKEFVDVRDCRLS